MARKSKSVYTKIEEIKAEISLTEEHLIQLKSQLEELKKERNNLEMELTWQMILDKGLTMEEVKSMLNEIVK